MLALLLAGLAAATCGVSSCPMDAAPQTTTVVLPPRFELAQLHHGNRRGTAVRLDLGARYHHGSGFTLGLVAPVVWVREGIYEAFGLASPVGYLEWSPRSAELVVRPVFGAQLEVPLGSPQLVGEHLETLPYLGVHGMGQGWMFDARLAGRFGTHGHDRRRVRTTTTTDTHTGVVDTHTTTHDPNGLALWNGADLLAPHGQRELSTRIQLAALPSERTVLGLRADGAHVFDARTPARDPWTVGPLVRWSVVEDTWLSAAVDLPITADRRVDWRGSLSAQILL